MFMNITRYMGMCEDTKAQQSTKEAISRAYYELIYRSTRVKYRSKVYKMHVLALLPAIYREENYIESLRDPHCHRSRARLGRREMIFARPPSPSRRWSRPRRPGNDERARPEGGPGRRDARPFAHIASHISSRRECTCRGA